ncbi:White-opaque regulator 1 [Lasiodiplodia hormozganensis]|uniref:White-opaque regulator 1 n=1 Tax=Lasiodiplodia hormozganensis TaxID=869390 RepID=A0AA39Y7Z4_9PEZI|nr:White-opaque regulator 1 [Lasiodiplodia hormozganensis]
MADQSPNPPSRQPQQQQPAQQQPQPQQNSQPQQQAQQTPTSYPSPHSYPSPSMQPSYTYPPPQGAPGNAEPYRASPTASSMSLPSLNLPPIRAPIDGQQPQQQPGQPPAGSLPPPVAPMAYYPPPGHAPPQHHQMHMAAPMGMPPQGMGMRYQLPPQADQRIMSGGRHKKEIKRRTKTGCLTCRKRRIKCDEAHPTCRNCQKSKRECLGYDPIFKQQPGPAQIQPAPSAAPPVTSTPATAAPPPAQVAYSHVPQGYAPAAPNYAPVPGHSTSPPAPAPDPSYELSAAIDPALAGADTSAPMSIAPVAYDPSTRVYVRKEDKEGATPPPPEGQPLKAKRIYIDELFALQNVPPHAQPPTPGPINPNVVEEIKMLYSRDYAINMDRCIETTWYTTKGLNRLLNDPATMDLFAFFVSQIRVNQDYEMQRRTTSLEAKLVWKLLCLPRQHGGVANGANGTSEHETDLLQKETALRVEVLEALLTYQVLPFNPLAELIYDPQVPHLKQYEVDFWRHLGTFVTFRDADDESNRNIEATLSACRNILGMIECRDVIYSMMIARHYGGRFPDLPDNVSQQPYPPDQEDDRSKMVVAKKFLEDESQGRGMSQVIFRLAGMAIRSWSLGQ